MLPRVQTAIALGLVAGLVCPAAAGPGRNAARAARSKAVARATTRPVVSDNFARFDGVDHLEVVRLAAAEGTALMASLDAHPERAVFDVVHLGGGKSALDRYYGAQRALGHRPRFLIVEESSADAFDPSGQVAFRYESWAIGWSARVLREGAEQVFDRTITRVESGGAGLGWPGRFRITTDRGETLYADAVEVARDREVERSTSAQAVNPPVASR